MKTVVVMRKWTDDGQPCGRVRLVIATLRTAKFLRSTPSGDSVACDDADCGKCLMCQELAQERL